MATQTTAEAVAALTARTQQVLNAATAISAQGGDLNVAVTTATAKAVIATTKADEATAAQTSATASAAAAVASAAAAEAAKASAASSAATVSSAVTGAVMRPELASAAGADSLVGYQRDSVAILRAVGDKLDAFLSFDEYMSPAELVDSRSSTQSIDITASLQKAVDNNKGYRIVGTPGRVYHANGLVLEGSTYNGTELVFRGKLLQRQRASAGTTNFGGAYAAVLLRDCEVSIDMLADQQRLVQPAEEHIYLLGLAGVRNTKINVRGINLRGDAVYCGQYNWQASSANTDGVMGQVVAWNPVDDGRNAFSHISGDNVRLKVASVRVGGVINNVVMPGGYDMEPDHSYHSCKNTIIESAHIITAGTSGLAFAGIVGTNVSANLTVGPALVINTCAPNVLDAAGNLTQTDRHTLLVNSVRGTVKIPNYQGRFTNAYGDAIIVADSSGLEMNATVSHVRTGARLGGDDKDASGGGAGVTNSDIVVRVSDFSRFGIHTGKVSSTKIGGKVTAPVVGMYPGSLMGVISMSNPSFVFTQKDVTYSVDVPSHPDLTRSMRNDASYPVIYDNCVQKDCDRSGSTWADQVYQIGDMKMPMTNVRGVTERATIPPALATLFVDGQRFINTSNGGLDVPLGWRYDATANLMRPMSANPFRRRISRNYQLTENFDASLYDIFSLNIQANGALTYNAPTGGTLGQEVTITVRNVSGGAMGAITWASGFKMASDWVNPANGKSRSITFVYDGTNWIQTVPVTGDVSN